MASGRLHQFSPQRTSPEDLEAIMVARESLLDAVLSRVRDSASTKNRFHQLFVGPRGIGKTHLVALINHRVQQDAFLRSQVRIAWLNEDETSSRFLHLLVRIFRSLSAQYPEEFPATDVQSVMGLNADEALHRLSGMLVERTGTHTILLLIENLDAHFAKFSVEEQRRWRGFMQDHPIITMVATAQRLFDGIRKQDETFFGFFDTQHLQPLTVDQTSVMLEKIAVLHGNTELQRVLKTSKGRSRLRVVHFLAGGNPRLYVLLSELITEDSLDDVVDTFELMVDQQLTSYYQERLRWLAPLQQDIVQVLCRHRVAVSVKLIAEELFTTNQSISGQLKELKSFGYVQFTKVGRETHYELAEPLMRLVMQVKETASHQPLLLLVEFLQVWFDRDELQQKLDRHFGDSLGRIYLTAAVETYEKFTALWPELRAPQASRPDLEELTRMIESPESTPAERAKALFNRGVTFGQEGDEESKVFDFTSVIQLTGAPVELIARALVNRGATFGRQGDTASEIRDYTSVLELTGAPVDHVATALVNRGTAFIRTGRTDLAIADLVRVLQYDTDDLRADVIANVNGFCSAMSSILIAADQSEWHHLGKSMLSWVTELHIEEHLGQSLVRQLKTLKDSGTSADRLDAWNQTWQKLGKGIEPLIVPLRLLNVGVSFLMTKKEEVLLQLPIEERRIVSEALGLSDSET